MTDLTLIQGGKSDTVTDTNTSSEKELNYLDVTLGFASKEPGVDHTMADVLSGFENIMEALTPMIIANQSASLGLSYGEYSTMVIQTKVVKTIMVKSDYEELSEQFRDLYHLD